MSTAETKDLIEQAVHRFQGDVPALKPLKLVIRLELQARGESPVWRVELPGPAVSKDPAADARVSVSMPRVFFNELARDGRLDRTFSGNGRARTDFGGRFDDALGVTIQTDGKIVVVGRATDDIAVARYDAEGDRDATLQ